MAGLQLVTDGTFATALKFVDYATPDYASQAHRRLTGKFYKPM